MKTLYLITGTSTGIGLALCTQAIAQEDSVVLGVARRPTPLQAPNFHDLTVDLSRDDAAAILVQTMDPWWDHGFDRMVLIQNAGTLGKIAANRSLDALDIANTVQLNLGTPMALQGALAAQCTHRQIHLEVINISSGAAQKAYGGWSAYCATKAGLEMASAAMALEEKDNPHFKIWSLAPGVVDTPMQEAIRAADPEQFPMHGRFVELHQKQLLVSPELVASKLLAHVSSDLIPSGSRWNLHELPNS